MSKALGWIFIAPLLIVLLLRTESSTAAVSLQREPDLPPGNFVARVYYSDISDINGLQDYDVWEYNNLDERYVLVALNSREYLKLQNEGWRLEIDRQGTEEIQSPLLRPFQDGYHTVEEVYAEMAGYAAQYPELTELFTYGQGTCLQRGGCTTLGGDPFPGYPLMALRISNESQPGTSLIYGQEIIMGSKPVFFLMANIHARELTTTELGLKMISWLLNDYGADADITWLVDWNEIWIIPTANPEGHWLVELGSTEEYGNLPFFQRKNLNLDADGDQNPDCTMWPPSPTWQYGVDLNRNHSFGWGPPGSSAAPCSQTFRGLEPASESETTALQDLISALIPDQRGPLLEDPAPEDTNGLLLTLHSYSELVLRPWSYTNAPAPNASGLKAISDKLATYNGYLSCQPGSCLYDANGTTDDWTYGELGIPAFTFEIGSEFIPPYVVIDSIQWPENSPAFLFAAKIARTPYQTILGPDTTLVQTEILTQTNQLKISALVNDGDHGQQTVTGAAYAINSPFWDPSAAPHPMEAADGSFDQIIEEVTAVIPLWELEPGKQIIFVHGLDSAGNWGVTSAVFVEIPENNQPNFSYIPFLAAAP